MGVGCDLSLCGAISDCPSHPWSVGGPIVQCSPFSVIPFLRWSSCTPDATSATALVLLSAFTHLLRRSLWSLRGSIASSPKAAKVLTRIWSEQAPLSAGARYLPRLRRADASVTGRWSSPKHSHPQPRIFAEIGAVDTLRQRASPAESSGTNLKDTPPA